MRSFRYDIRLLLVLLLLLISNTIYAGETTLSNNSGTGNTTWFIDGEPTLVINGFDLTPLNLRFPVTIDAITIDVVQPVPGVPIDVVIYEDSNGGSPADAVVISRSQTTINDAGIARIVLPQAVDVNSPVVWAGFYLPVDFRFRADASGTSVLTYWGWAPGTTFDIGALSSAPVFGPADGSAPVQIDLGGIARINIEITQAAGAATGPGPVNSGPIGQQLVAETSVNFSVMDRYPYCGESLFFDTEDISVTALGRFQLFCRADLGNFGAGTFRNLNDAPAEIRSFERRGFLYDIFPGGDYAADPRNAEKLSVPVTHCIRPAQADLERAVIGIGYGAPRTWSILPSVRFGELVCAEMTHIGFISYFIPRTGEEATVNANLMFTGNPQTDEYPLFCGQITPVDFAVYNEGFEVVNNVIVRVQDIHLRTGQTTVTKDYNIGSVPPGGTIDFRGLDFRAPSLYFSEAHRLLFIIDPENSINELNNEDNVFSFEYILQRGNC